MYEPLSNVGAWDNSIWFSSLCVEDQLNVQLVGARLWHLQVSVSLSFGWCSQCAEPGVLDEDGNFGVQFENYVFVVDQLKRMCVISSLDSPVLLHQIQLSNVVFTMCMHLSKQKLMELLVLFETWRIWLVVSIIAAYQSKIGPSQYSLLSNSITTHHALLQADLHQFNE